MKLIEFRIKSDHMWFLIEAPGLNCAYQETQLNSHMTGPHFWLKISRGCLSLHNKNYKQKNVLFVSWEDWNANKFFKAHSATMNSYQWQECFFSLQYILILIFRSQLWKNKLPSDLNTVVFSRWAGKDPFITSPSSAKTWAWGKRMSI